MDGIKQMREALEITQKQLADKMGVERSTVAKWEAGVACPAAAKLPKLAEVLGCSVADLFAKAEIPAPQLRRCALFLPLPAR